MSREVAIHSLLKLAGETNKLTYSEGVTDQVIKHLQKLVPDDMYISMSSFEPFIPAIQQLCSAKSEPDIDWLGLINLASNLCNLIKAGWV